MFKHPNFEFVTLLEQHEVPFVIVGGYAINIYAPPRATEDVDVVWIRDDDAEIKLAAALNDANASWISNERDPQTGIEKLVRVDLGYVRIQHLMMLWTDYGFVDLFDFVPGMPAEDVKRFYADSTVVGGRRYASLEWMKKMKRAASRPKDLQDLANLP